MLSRDASDVSVPRQAAKRAVEVLALVRVANLGDGANARLRKGDAIVGDELGEDDVVGLVGGPSTAVDVVGVGDADFASEGDVGIEAKLLLLLLLEGEGDGGLDLSASLGLRSRLSVEGRWVVEASYDLSVGRGLLVVKGDSALDEGGK